MPAAYIPTDVDKQVRIAAANRCGYCHCPQSLHVGLLEIDHIIPVSKGGSHDEVNLWLACRSCNGHKSNKMTAIDPETGQLSSLFNPRTQVWNEHFCWSQEGLQVIGLTPIGRATVAALHLADDPNSLLVRSLWIDFGLHPPKTD